MYKTITELKKKFKECYQENEPSFENTGKNKFLKHICQLMTNLKKEQVAACMLNGTDFIIATNQKDEPTFNDMVIFLQAGAKYILDESKQQPKFEEVNISNTSSGYIPMFFEKGLRKKITPIISNITSKTDTRKYSVPQDLRSKYEEFTTKDLVNAMLSSITFRELAAIESFSNAFSIIENTLMDMLVNKKLALKVLSGNFIYVNSFYTELSTSIANRIHCEMKVLDYVFHFNDYSEDYLSFIANTKYCCRQCYFMMKQVQKLAKKDIIAGGHNILFQNNWDFPLFVNNNENIFKKFVRAAVGKNDKEINSELDDPQKLSGIKWELEDIFIDGKQEIEEYEQGFPFSPITIPEDFGNSPYFIRGVFEFSEKDLEDVVNEWGKRKIRKVNEDDIPPKKKIKKDPDFTYHRKIRVVQRKLRPRRVKSDINYRDW